MKKVFIVFLILTLSGCDAIDTMWHQSRDEVVMSKSSPEQFNSPPVVGRYQLVFSPLVRADTYLVDSVEGYVWQMVVDSQGEESFQALNVGIFTPEQRSASDSTSFQKRMRKKLSENDHDKN